MDPGANVVELPRRPTAHSTVEGATFYDICLDRIRLVLGHLAGRAGVPGFIRDTVIDDPVTGQQIEIRVYALDTRLTIDGRDYYFGRVSGRLEGAGMAYCTNPDPGMKEPVVQGLRSSYCRSGPTLGSGPFPGRPYRP